MEVLVVDGMSDDGTREILNDWCRRKPNLRVLDNLRHIASTALNIGIRAARVKWILILGAHCEYSSNYLQICLETSIRTGAENVGGGIVTLSSSRNIEGELVQALTTHPFGVGNARFRLKAREGRSDTASYGCYRREVFDRIGLYDERLVRNQDYELNRRLLKAGGSVWFNPAIRAQYYNQSTLKGLFRQAFLTGQWNTWMWFVAPYSFAWRHAVPLAFVGAFLAILVFFFLKPAVGALLLQVILIPYFAVAACASLQQSIRSRIWMLPCLPLLFFIYHIAYGLGGLCGILLLLLHRAPVQQVPEPWPGAGAYRLRPDQIAHS